MEKKLSIKKSIKILKDMLVWSAMIVWIVFLTVLLSSKVEAQTLQNGPLVEYVDVDCYKVTTENGGYYHVNSNGELNGWFKMVSKVQDVTMVATGQMRKGKKIGKVVYTVNGKRVMVRYYDINGILQKSVKVNVSPGTIS